MLLPVAHHTLQWAVGLQEILYQGLFSNLITNLKAKHTKFGFRERNTRTLD